MVTKRNRVDETLRTLALGLLLLTGHLAAAAQNTSGSPSMRPPSVVLILADDLGYSDTTLYGTTSLYRTPNIERLAKRGMTFNRAYSSSPLCSPTRASVLTGLSPARHGITAPNCHTPKVALRPLVKSTGPPQRFSTVPDSATRLDTQHYTLAEMLRDHGYATGHFGKWHLGPEPYSPLEHGFDIDIPHHPGPGPAGSYVAPWKFADFDHDPDIPDQHLEDRMAKEAVAFMEEHQREPFFLNYWMFSVHAPFDAKADLIRAYKERIDPDSAQRSPTYAAMIESMDDAVGTLLDTLDRLQLADNTIIIFASDNGGNMYNFVDGGTATSNAPLRGGKATMYEGGVRGPAIVVQPGKIAAGSRSDQIIQSSDYYPTLLEMLQLPAAPGQTFDGISIVPALQGGILRRDFIFTYFPHAPSVPQWLPPSVSVHSGNWKLIRIFHGGPNGAHRYQLFNLKQDLGEKRNVADQFPDVVRKLDASIEQHLAHTKAARPLLNPSYDGSYNLTKEGVAVLKGKPGQPTAKAGRRKGPAAGSKKRQPLVAGWQAGGTCSLVSSPDGLTVNSSGKDPYFSYQLKQRLPAGTYRLQITMKSQSGGGGQLFWREDGQPRYSKEFSRSFDVTHDGNLHAYELTFDTRQPLVSVRVDPSRRAGDITVTSILLTNAAGERENLLPTETR
ncbi:MAG: sulfatase [Planctomycetaceae bacterium]|nr:sulfatase [Planctomycetaceae bacterium]